MKYVIRRFATVKLHGRILRRSFHRDATSDVEFQANMILYMKALSDAKRLRNCIVVDQVRLFKLTLNK